MTGPSFSRPPAPQEPPPFVRTILDRALAHFQEGRLDGAEVLLATLTEEASVAPLVLHLRGVIALHLGEKDRARQFLVAAIEANPADAEAHANLGILLLDTHAYPQAAAAFAAALSLDARQASWHYGSARALASEGLFDLAIEGYRDAIARDPDHVDARVELGALLTDCGEVAEGVAILREAARRHPGRASVHLALASALFAAGDWESAWAEYDWRLSDPDAMPSPGDLPRWDGEDPAGKTIRVQCEQGFGDTLQFIRYVPMLAARRAAVILGAPVQLHELLRSVAGVTAVIGPEDNAPQSDFHVPLLSLPRHFSTREETIPSAGPYLLADESTVAAWRERLGAFDGLSIGLCWQGNPEHERDRFRSIRLEVLRPLLACPGARFVSLQVGPGEDQRAALADPRIIDPFLAVASPSFADTAAIIAGLDLVISVDSAIAHLSGALGKPAWILLDARADWRWLRERGDTPWYPEARLFRQSRLRDWDELVARVGTALWSYASAPEPFQGAADRPARRKPEPSLCDALFVDAMRHYQQNDLARSMKLFERVLFFDPGHVATLCNLGALAARNGDVRRGLELLQRAVALAPALPEARLALAEALLATGEVDAALVQFREGLALAPQSDHAHAAFAMALESLGWHDAAMPHFEQAVALDQFQGPHFYEALGRSSRARNNLEGAEICFTHALELDPRRAPAHAGLGEVLFALGRRVDAVASFLRALEIDAHYEAALAGLERARPGEASTTSAPRG